VSETRRRLLWLFGAALILRLLYIGVGIEVPPQDTPDYDEIAHNLLAGEGFVASSNWFGHELRAWRAPLYPLLLAAVYAVWDSHVAVQVVQAVLGAVTVILIYLLTRRLHPAAALVAGWLAVAYEPLVASTNEVMTEVLFTMLLVAGVAAAIEARHRRAWYWPAAAGILVGLAALTRPVGLLAVPAILAVSAWEDFSGRRAWQRWAPFAGLLSAGLLAAMLPWTLRNAAVLGAFVPVSTHGGFVVARSNAEHPDWRQAQGWQIDEKTFDTYPGEVERDRHWMDQGMRWIADHPVIWLRLGAERFLRFWYVFRPDYNAAFVIIVPFLLAGLWNRGRDPGFRHLSAVSALSIAVFCLILYGSTRFRLPLEAFFLVFAASAVIDGWHRWGVRFAAVGGAWVGCNTLARLFDDSLRGAVVGLLRAGGLK
jgi:4-amino-4-deoxy-L-arabinose transferase-like glycosyltransferase